MKSETKLGWLLFGVLVAPAFLAFVTGNAWWLWFYLAFALIAGFAG